MRGFNAWLNAWVQCARLAKRAQGRSLRPKPRPRCGGNAREHVRAQAGGDFLDVFVMPRLQRRTQLLREEITDQGDAPVPQLDALIEQRDCGVGIALLTRALGETRGG